MPSKTELLKQEKLKREALKNSYIFCKHILNYSKMEKRPHQELCTFLMDKSKRKKLILLPRGSFKSSVTTVGHSIYDLVKDPNQRILICSENYTNSVTYINEIKQHLEHNSLFKRLYGDLRPTGDGGWKMDEITINTRTRIMKEPTVHTSSIGQTRVGMHYQKIVFDDIVSNNNINTPEQLQKTIDYYKYALSILEPDGELIVIGTRYHYGDLYSYILENHADEFLVMMRGAYYDDGSLFFPTVLTEDYLQEQKRAMGSHLFHTQYMNQVVDYDNATFKQEWINYYKNAPRNLNVYITLDPAISADRDSDNTAIIVAGIDCSNNIFVLEDLCLRETLADIIDVLFKMAIQYKPACVGIETVGFQQTIKHQVSAEMNKRNVWFPIKETTRTNRVSKVRKIMGLQPLFENGKIYLKQEHINLIDQILRFPKTKHDDQIDALAMMLEMNMIPPEMDREANVLDKNPRLSDNERQEWTNMQKIFSRKIRRTKAGIRV